MNNPVIPQIIDQHAEEAAFLWLLRSNAVEAPHYSLQQLAELDERLEAHLDGLRISGEYGWEICRKNLDLNAEGELFAATVLAIESEDKRKLKSVYEALYANQELKKGFVSALGWADGKFLQGKVSGLLISKDAFWREIGLAVCAVQRVDPGGHLSRAIADEDVHLACRGLRAAGLLGRSDLATDLLKAMTSDSAEKRFWAAWAAVMCGDRDKAAAQLQSHILEDGQFAGFASELAFRLLPPAESRNLMTSLKGQGKMRLLVQAAGMTGDPAYIPWLIEQMQIAELARPAGESLSLISGLDLAYDDFERDAPEDFQAGPTESADDDNVELDEDEDLPWPDAELLDAWWRRRKSDFQAGRRYLLGRPVSASQCRNVLINGMQRQRRAAAIEQVMQAPGAVLFETRAAGKRQQLALSK